MTKQEFIERVMNLSEYNKKENMLEKILNINYENFIGDMINEMGDILIKTVNPNLEGLAKDYFYETFWNNLNETANKDDWNIFYDLLVEGKIDSKYIEIYR